jgi:2-polyprenyl-6-methoxyphenol hydroxylase-like FAD-dependent oxidoreductase
MGSIETCVVGGGPVGMLAAACLHERGLSVRVVDADGERPVRGYACGLHPETLRLLHRLGMLARVSEHAHRVDRLAVYRNRDKVAALEFDKFAGACPHVLTLRQHHLEHILADDLARRGVEVIRRRVVTGFTPREQSVRMLTAPRSAVSDDIDMQLGAGLTGASEDDVEYVIAADGYHSHCREALGIQLSEVQAPDAYVLFEFEADLAEIQHEACVALTGDIVASFWPLGPSLGRWTFQVWDHLDQIPGLDRLRELLEARAPWFRPRPERVCWSSTAHFEQRVAARFGRGRTWLAGDAAHVTSPIGFQSMNRGFVESSELASAIGAALAREQGHQANFERFERDQQSEWRRLLGIQTRLVSDGPLSNVEAARLVRCLPATGADMQALMDQLWLRFVRKEEAS